MNIKFVIPTLLTAASLSLMSCKKWLDVSPKTQIRESVLLSDEQGFKDALTGVYLKMGANTIYGQNLTMGFLDALAQRYTVSATTHTFYQSAYKFNYADVSAKNYISAIWGGLYSAIANANNIITQIDDRKELFSGNNFNQVKGEALALRALMHFDVLRMFGASPAVDLQKKSIPYVTRFGVDVYPLLPIAAVMDSCLKDLADAEQLLSNDKEIRNAYNQDAFLSYTRNHMNYWAVKGLQARIYLYRGDKVNALNAALAVINNKGDRFPFVNTTQAGATTNRDRLYYSEHLFALYAYKLKAYTEAYTKTNTAGGTPTTVTSSTNLNTLYEISSGGSSDIRYNYQFQAYSSSYATSKYWQDDIVTSSAYDYLKNLVPIIRLSEMYYIAAECASGAAEGVAYLNVIRAARGLGALATTISSTTLTAEILKEYKKEFYAEGQLFYYFKRLNAAKIDGNTLAAGEAVYVLPMPDNEIEFANRF